MDFRITPRFQDVVRRAIGDYVNGVPNPGEDETHLVISACKGANLDPADVLRGIEGSTSASTILFFLAKIAQIREVKELKRHTQREVEGFVVGTLNDLILNIDQYQIVGKVYRSVGNYKDKSEALQEFCKAIGITFPELHIEIIKELEEVAHGLCKERDQLSERLFVYGKRMKISKLETNISEVWKEIDDLRKNDIKNLLNTFTNANSYEEFYRTFRIEKVENLIAQNLNSLYDWYEKYCG